MVDIQSATTEIRRGKKERKKKPDKNIMSAPATQSQNGHNKKQCTLQKFMKMTFYYQFISITLLVQQNYIDRYKNTMNSTNTSCIMKQHYTQMKTT